MTMQVSQRIGDFITADNSEVSFSINSKLKNMIKEELEKNIKSGLWEDDLPDSWLDDINVTVNGDVVTVQVNNEAAIAHEEGVDPHPQWYLIGKTIPIETDSEGNDQVVFRKCTMDSLMQGKFWHPGMEGKGFIEDAIDSASRRIEEVVEAAHRPDKQKYENQVDEVL